MRYYNCALRARFNFNVILIKVKSLMHENLHVTRCHVEEEQGFIRIVEQIAYNFTSTH